MCLDLIEDESIHHGVIRNHDILIPSIARLNNRKTKQYKMLITSGISHKVIHTYFHIIEPMVISETFYIYLWHKLFSTGYAPVNVNTVPPRLNWGLT